MTSPPASDQPGSNSPSPSPSARLSDVVAETLSPAKASERLIQHFGGIRPMANKLEVPVTTVQGWKKRGAIPATRLNDLRAAAQRHGITLDEAELEAVSRSDDRHGDAARPNAAGPELEPVALPETGAIPVNVPLAIPLAGTPKTEPVPPFELPQPPLTVGKPTAKLMAKPVGTPIAEPIAELLAKPATKPTTKLLEEPAVEPTPVVGPTPVVELAPVVEPTPVVELTIKPIAEPIAEPISKPITAPRAEPPAAPSPKPVAEPVIELLTDLTGALSRVATAVQPTQTSFPSSASSSSSSSVSTAPVRPAAVAAAAARLAAAAPLAATGSRLLALGSTRLAIAAAIVALVAATLTVWLLSSSTSGSSSVAVPGSERRLGDLESKVARVTLDQGAQSAALEKKLGALDTKMSQTASQQTAAELAQRIAVLEHDLPLLQQRVASQGIGAPALGVLLSATQLRGVLATSNPFVNELAALRLTGITDAPLKQALEQISGRATTGIATESWLIGRFSAVQGNILRASSIGHPGTRVADMFLDVLSDMAPPLYRLTGVSEGTSPRAIADRAQAAMAAGDFPHAVEAVGELTGLPAEVAAPWLAEAKARVIADRSRALLAKTMLAIAQPGSP